MGAAARACVRRPLETHANACVGPRRRRRWGARIFGSNLTLSGRQTRARPPRARPTAEASRADFRAAVTSSTHQRPTNLEPLDIDDPTRGAPNGSGLVAAPTRQTTHQRPPQARRTRLAGLWWVVGGQWLDVWRSMSARSSSAPMCPAMSSTCSRSTPSACSAHVPLTW